MSAQRTAHAPLNASSGWGERLVTFVLLAALALLSAYIFLRALGVLPAGALLPAELARGPLLGWIEALPTQQARLIAAGVALSVGLLSLWGLSRGGGGRQKRPFTGEWLQVLEADERGLVVIAGEGVEAVARTAVQGTPGVFDASVSARPSGRGVSLVVDISVLEGADVRRAGLGARDRAVEAIERFVGLDVNKVQVRVDVLSPEDVGRTVL